MLPQHFCACWSGDKAYRRQEPADLQAVVDAGRADVPVRSLRPLHRVRRPQDRSRGDGEGRCGSQRGTEKWHPNRRSGHGCRGAQKEVTASRMTAPRGHHCPAGPARPATKARMLMRNARQHRPGPVRAPGRLGHGLSAPPGPANAQGRGPMGPGCPPLADRTPAYRAGDPPPGAQGRSAVPASGDAAGCVKARGRWEAQGGMAGGSKK